MLGAECRDTCSRLVSAGVSTAMDSAMSMLIIAKPVVNMLIANAETQYVGAEPGELESSPNVCSLAPLHELSCLDPL